jgi:hypothetical protein
MKATVLGLLFGWAVGCGVETPTIANNQPSGGFHAARCSGTVGCADLDPLHEKDTAHEDQIHADTVGLGDQSDAALTAVGLGQIYPSVSGPPTTHSQGLTSSASVRANGPILNDRPADGRDGDDSNGDQSDAAVTAMYCYVDCPPPPKR